MKDKEIRMITALLLIVCCQVDIEDDRTKPYHEAAVRVMQRTQQGSGVVVHANKDTLPGC